jgi:hypothetical protein
VSYLYLVHTYQTHDESAYMIAPSTSMEVNDVGKIFEPFPTLYYLLPCEFNDEAQPTRTRVAGERSAGATG